MTPAIVILGYERPDALRRLLQSVAAARYPAGGMVPLVISLDRSARPAGADTAVVANAFDWPHGPKRVLQREEHLGVVRHFREAGGLTREYGSIVLLEDDLTVSPAFYEFATAVLGAYGDEERVAGCCLYGLWFNGFTLEPFMPIEDGHDVFFLGVPHTQGLCFSAAQWSAFEASWRPGAVRPHPALHPAFLDFPPDEWFPALASYLAETGRYFVFPRVSLTVGWGDAGAHFARGTSWFQTPLQYGHRRYSLPTLDEAVGVYDGFFELLPDRLRRLAPSLPAAGFDVDINATKQPANLRADLVLTSRPVRSAVKTYGLEMYPPEANVIADVPRTELSLARAADVMWDEAAGIEARRRLHRYAWRRHRPSRMRELRFAAARGRAAVGRLLARIRRAAP